MAACLATSSFLTRSLGPGGRWLPIAALRGCILGGFSVLYGGSRLAEGSIPAGGSRVLMLVLLAGDSGSAPCSLLDGSLRPAMGCVCAGTSRLAALTLRTGHSRPPMTLLLGGS